MNHAEILERVSLERLKHDIFYLCREPFPFRTVKYTIPWHEKNSLDETDEFIAGEMRKYVPNVNLIPYKLRPFRCDSKKPLHHWYSSPLPDDPWYDAHCIEVVIPGKTHPEEIIQLVSHKDSMSWINAPGAHDNAVGAVVNMEIVRVLSTLELDRTVRVLFCNEEHTPWYSLNYAQDAFKRGDKIIAVMNQDSICGKSDEAAAAGIMTNVAAYSTDEGKALADFLVAETAKYKLPLVSTTFFKERVNDDDGSFIKAGYLRTVMNIGSMPYADPQYHLPGDIPERVNLMNLTLVARLIAGAALDLSAEGQAVFG